MNKLLILLLTVFFILSNVTESSVLKKRHGPFTACAGQYPNTVSITLSPNKLVYGQHATITLVGTSKVPIYQGARYEIAIDRDDNTSIMNASFDICASVGTNCPLPAGNNVISLSFPMPLVSPVAQDGKNYYYSMAFSIKNADQTYLSCVLGYVDFA
ncbi:15689_t:CDS:2 [Funneliformis mosseae]|uniref:Phosphatidylglycerol/phosphatidylinositol transfer protein n=1 Tax=Funneliformis mosseae TaxID=27381 RepID=A0A9N8Z1I1_FUNMO|nr:15689_t:CDS:2 [Funneliformis mosseae]